MTSAKHARRTAPAGLRALLSAFWLTMLFIVLTHCSWPSVMVALPSVSALMRMKLSTMAPMKRLRAMKLPGDIGEI